MTIFLQYQSHIIRTDYIYHIGYSNAQGGMGGGEKKLDVQQGRLRLLGVYSF